MSWLRFEWASALVAGYFFTCGVSGCREKVPAPEEKPPREWDVQLSERALEGARIRTGQPRSALVRTSVVAHGTIDFVQSRVARIGPSISGRISQVMVAPGAHVQKGAVLLLLESADVGKARAEYLAAKSRLQQADAELGRERKLFGGGASSERAVLASETEKNVADFGLRAAEDRLKTLGPGARAGAASSIPLLTPLDGTVLEVKARLGQPVGPADSLVVVGEINEVWLSVDVYERDLAKVHEGDDVEVTTIAYPNRPFAGRVDHVSTTVDLERRASEARIVLANVDGALRPGMTATAHVLGKVEADAGTMLVLPRGAVQTIDGQPFVFVEHQRGKYELRPIERGEGVGDEVEVARGLKGDETVVIDGTFILKSEVLKAQMGAND